MADADSDQASKYLLQKPNVELINSFTLKKTFRNIFFTINEDDNPEPDNQFFLETEPLLKSFPTTTIILIKKTPILNCSDAKTIKKGLQVLNFSTEGNDATVIPTFKIVFRMHSGLFLILIRKH